MCGRSAFFVGFALGLCRAAAAFLAQDLDSLSMIFLLSAESPKGAALDARAQSLKPAFVSLSQFLDLAWLEFP